MSARACIVTALGGVALASCASDGPTHVGACLNVEVGERVSFMMMSKLQDHDWKSSAGYTRIGTSGDRLCLGHDGSNWPLSTDISFGVELNPPFHRAEGEFIPTYDCGGAVLAGDIPRARDLEFEFVRVRLGYACQVREVRAR